MILGQLVIMITGTVKYFSHARSYSFIVWDEEKKDVLVYKSGLQDGIVIDEWDKVEFEVCEGKRGKTAMNVKIIKKAPVLRKIIYWTNNGEIMAKGTINSLIPLEALFQVPLFRLGIAGLVMFFFVLVSVGYVSL